MRIPTPDQWRYEGLAESLAKMIRQDPDFLTQEERLEEFLLDAFDKVYRMGQNDPAAAHENITKGIEVGLRIARPVISVTDLSGMPEILERIKERWKTGSCH